MTLRLILVRHAKSSWDDPLMDDHDRVLNKRGRKSAAAIGAWLAERGHIPAEVVSSTARRTLETWERMAPAFPEATLLRRDPTLYHAPVPMMFDALHDCAASPVMMLGHNPGIGAFAGELVEVPPAHERFGDYPTCATLVADFEAADWAEITPGSGRVVDFVVPRELT